jgi:hypothetical protein
MTSTSKQGHAEHNFLIAHIKKSTHFSVSHACATQLFAHSLATFTGARETSLAFKFQEAGFRGIWGPPPIARGERSATMHRYSLCDFKTPSKVTSWLGWLSTNIVRGVALSPLPLPVFVPADPLMSSLAFGSDQRGDTTGPSSLASPSPSKRPSPVVYEWEMLGLNPTGTYFFLFFQLYPVA